jgi:hypothetical protein
VTSVDCIAGLVCLSSQDGGTCQQPTIPAIVGCGSKGSNCGGAADAPCCGFCVQGTCKDLGEVPCATYVGAPCNGPSDCCSFLSCDAGTCQATCGGENAPCNPANGNGDCCVQLGQTCQGYGGDGGTPYECNNGYAVQPGTGCATYCAVGGPPECQLGAPCEPASTGLDNCVAAGLFCDPGFDVCVGPERGDLCIQGGPPCGGPVELVNTNVQMVCVSGLAGFGGPVCSDLCASTKDCFKSGDACDTSSTPPICVPAFLVQSCTGPFGTCDSAGTNDGICEPYNDNGGIVGWCTQANPDGGGPGTVCSISANRENPAFCDTADLCNGGICVPICNAGTGTDRHCDAGQRCIPLNGQTSDVQDMGYCVTDCDFLSDGGCIPPDGGTAEVCLPDLLFGYGDDDMGICAGQTANPLPVGATCTPLNANGIVTPSPCVAGAACINPPTGGNFCTQLCIIGTACPNGTDCQSINITAGLYSSVTGACFLHNDAG